MEVRKGEIYDYVPSDILRGNLTRKPRPVVVVSHKHGGSTTIATVVPLTTKVKGNYINEVIFHNQDHTAVAMCTQMRAINITDLRRKTGRVPNFVLKKIDEALCYHLGISDAPDYLLAETVDNDDYYEQMDYTPQSQVEKFNARYNKLTKGGGTKFERKQVVDTKPPSKTRTYTKWTEEKDKRMFQICCKEGIEAAAKEFGVSTKTIQKRYYNIRKSLSASGVA